MSFVMTVIDAARDIAESFFDIKVANVAFGDLATVGLVFAFGLGVFWLFKKYMPKNWFETKE